jgi:hypothetical protein
VQVEDDVDVRANGIAYGLDAIAVFAELRVA